MVSWDACCAMSCTDSVSCRYDFIEFIRNGGRRPHAHPDPLTRQGSIELVSEASDPGQTEQQAPSPTHQQAGADPLTPHSNAGGLTPDPINPVLILKASHGQQQYPVGLPPKLPALQTTVCGRPKLA